ncbi:MAG: hypothetical protein AAF514_18240 [Verrucomicrobiota bacterium]
MHRFCSLFVFLFLPLGLLQAQKSERSSQLEITTLRGKTFKKVEIIQIEPDGILITHQNGAAKLLYDELKAADKSRYGYNPAVVRQAEEKRQQTAMGAKAAKKQNPTPRGKAQPRVFIAFLPVPARSDAYPDHTVPVHSTYGHPVFVSPHLYHYQNNLVPRNHYHPGGEFRVGQRRAAGNPIAAPMNSYRTFAEARRNFVPMIYVPQARSR